jgi:hypothetical protein
MKTNMRAITVGAAIVLALITAACGDSVLPPTPNPGGGTPPRPAPTFSVSGTISEAIEGDRVGQRTARRRVGRELGH